jgi:hypothetical protein
LLPEEPVFWEVDKKLKTKKKSDCDNSCWHICF